MFDERIGLLPAADLGVGRNKQGIGADITSRRQSGTITDYSKTLQIIDVPLRNHYEAILSHLRYCEKKHDHPSPASSGKATSASLSTNAPFSKSNRGETFVRSSGVSFRSTISDLRETSVLSQRIMDPPALVFKITDGATESPRILLAMLCMDTYACRSLRLL